MNLLPALAIALAAGLGPAAQAGPLLTQAPADFNELVKAAKAEAELTVIACPHDWVNYGEIFSKFTAKYGIKLNELNPDGGSGDEIEAIKANRNNKGRQAPDVIDVGLAFGPQVRADHLVAPYKVRTWSTIPASVKDADGYWYGDYYGALAFEVNTDLVKNPPRDWADLLKPEYKGKVALSGDPRVSNQAFLTVAAAAVANGGSFTNIMPGLAFFKKLNGVGNFVPIIAVPGTVASGETPITVRWDYNALSNRDKSAGNPNIGIIIPATGVVAGVYIQAISAYAPHPNAARLYQEFLYSDEGQLLWLKGYGHPVRFDDLARRKVIPAAIAAKLPPAKAYAKALFPSIRDQEAIKKATAENWDKVVNVPVTKR
ncbi:MAG: extracellular solute-binding protein [Holophaga sp.]|nr:extracellular solute-binding protein [Holophaga sp.]